MLPTTAFVQQLQADLLRDLLAFLPELILIGTIVLMLLLRLFPACRHVHLGYLALATTSCALMLAIGQWTGVASLEPRTAPADAPALKLFTGLLLYDPFAIFARVFLLAFLGFATWLCLLTGIPDREDSADFITLLLGSTLGMMMMASANHLLTLFIAMEMASVPSYALAGFLKGRRQGSEAALKYVVYGASASGVMLYGISLIAGKFGTGFFPDLAVAIALNMKVGGLDPVLLAGCLFILVGLAFKLSVVPFHFWCPDVFEGAAAEVAAFLSVASKGAALVLTTRFLMLFVGDTQTRVLMIGSLGLVLAVLAAVTATVGNLAALAQSNLKRLLAYSTIAHAGYMLMALVPLTAVGSAAILFYLGAYLLMNLGALAVVACLRNLCRSEDLKDMAGMVHRAPLLVVTFAVFLLSLLGLPPLAGFAAKFQIFAALFDGAREAKTEGDFLVMTYVLYGLLVVAAVNTVISAAYYLRILRVMVLDSPPEGAPPLRVAPGTGALVCLLAGGVVILGLAWNPLMRACTFASHTFSEPIHPIKQQSPILGKER